MFFVHSSLSRLFVKQKLGFTNVCLAEKLDIAYIVATTQFYLVIAETSI